MRICENGIIRDMTAEEIAELTRLIAEAPGPEPTPEELLLDALAAMVEDVYNQDMESIEGEI